MSVTSQISCTRPRAGNKLQCDEANKFIKEQLSQVEQLNMKFNLKKGNKEIESFESLRSSTTLKIPVMENLLSAGFPSPAEDYIEKTTDLNDLLIHNELSTFIGRVGSLSMLNAGIEIGDRLVVDKSLEPQHRDIVVAIIDNNDFTVKRLMITKYMNQLEIQEIFSGQVSYQDLPPVWLKAENPDFENIIPHDGQEIRIWGKVTFILKAAK